MVLTLSREPLAATAQVRDKQEERVQQWRNDYQAYQNRLVAFYHSQAQFKERLKRQQEYHQTVRRQLEDLERYNNEREQLRNLHRRTRISW